MPFWLPFMRMKNELKNGCQRMKIKQTLILWCGDECGEVAKTQNLQWTSKTCQCQTRKWAGERSPSPSLQPASLLWNSHCHCHFHCPNPSDQLSPVPHERVHIVGRRRRRLTPSTSFEWMVSVGSMRRTRRWWGWALRQHCSHWLILRFVFLYIYIYIYKTCVNCVRPAILLMLMQSAGNWKIYSIQLNHSLALLCTPNLNMYICVHLVFERSLTVYYLNV